MVAAPRGAVTAALLLVFECLRLSIVARAEIEGMSPFLQLLCCLLFSTGLAACRCSLLLSTVLDTVLPLEASSQASFDQFWVETTRMA